MSVLYNLHHNNTQGSLSKDISGRNTSTGSEAFSHYLDANKCALLSPYLFEYAPNLKLAPTSNKRPPPLHSPMSDIEEAAPENSLIDLSDNEIEIEIE